MRTVARRCRRRWRGFRRREVDEIEARGRGRVRDPAERGRDRRVRADLAGRRHLRRTASAISPTRPTGASATPSPTARTAARATPSSATSRTTGRTPPWRASACARRARRSTTTRATAASTRSRTPARCAARRSPRDIGEAQRRLAAGEILAIKGLGGFHLACDARNAAAVRRLRERKRRSDKPFALMARDLAAAEAICRVSRRRRAGPDRPAAAHRDPARGASAAAFPDAVAPGNRTLGVMLPYTPLHHLLFADAPYDALVMTSGNLSEEPIVVPNEEALRAPGGRGRLVPAPQPRHLHARGRFGGAHLRGRGARAAAVARIRAADPRPGARRPRAAGLRRAN